MRRTLSIVACVLASVSLAGAGWFDEDGIGLWGADPVPASGVPEYANEAALPSSGQVDGDEAITADPGWKWEYVGTRNGDAINTWVPEPLAHRVLQWVDGTGGHCVIDVPAGDTVASLAAAAWTVTTTGSGTITDHGASTSIQLLATSGTTCQELICPVTTMPEHILVMAEVDVIDGDATAGHQSAVIWLPDGTRDPELGLAKSGTALNTALWSTGSATQAGSGEAAFTAYDRIWLYSSSTDGMRLQTPAYLRATPYALYSQAGTSSAKAIEVYICRVSEVRVRRLKAMKLSAP